MTEPTDTSRSGDLVELKAMLAKCNDSGHDWWLFALTAERDVPVLIDRIEALEAENERLREALDRIEGEPIPFSANPIVIITAMKETARAALKEIDNGDR